MNFVMTGKGCFVEIQGTAEGMPFTKDEMDQLILVASKGIQSIIQMQSEALNK